MIVVDTPLAEEPVKIDAPACEVLDNGTLLIFANRDATAVHSAYAPGAWAHFEMTGA
ncbi:hypothetical protein [Corynebacterium sp. HMSC072D12]|uniref:hypothetical protein n=1 Tax=Corynebacterium sp. HMSC072D12 TaxID=1739447 RepID=UPI00143C0B9F|nr:hypothetical protein [Corynebacterium sp. HMSC072D12]